MAKIREYTSQAGVQGAVRTRLPGQDSSSGALAMGKMVSGLGAQITKYNEESELRKAQLLAAQATEEEYKALDEAKKNANEDGSGFAEKYRVDAEGRNQKRLEQVSTATAQATLNNHLSSVRGTVTREAMTFQSQRLGEYTKTKFTETAVASDNSVFANPDRLDSYIEAETTLINSNQYLAESHKAEEYRNTRVRGMHDKALEGTVNNLQASDRTTPSQVQTALDDLRNPESRWIKSTNQPAYKQSIVQLERLKDSLKERQSSLALLSFGDEMNRIETHGLSADKGRFTPGWISQNVKDPRDAAALIKKQEESRAIGAEIDFTKGRPENQILAEINAREATVAGSEPYGAESKRLNALSSVYQARMRSWQKDAVATTLGESPLLQNKYEAFKKDPKNAKDYFLTLESEQNRLFPGRPTFVVSGQDSARMKNALDSVGIEETGAEKAVAVLQNEAAQYGSYWPKAVAEMRREKVLTGAHSVVANMSQDPLNHGLALDIMKSSAIPDADLRERLQAGDKISAHQSVASALSAFKKTIAHDANGTQLGIDYEDTLVKFALTQKYVTGKDTHLDVEKTFQRIIGDEFTFQDTYRVPVKYDADVVADRLRATLGRVATLPLVPPGGSGLKPADAERIYKNHVREGSIWVNTGDGTGVRLITSNGADVYQRAERTKIVDGKEVNYFEAIPVRYTFDEILGPQLWSTPK